MKVTMTTGSEIRPCQGCSALMAHAERLVLRVKEEHACRMQMQDELVMMAEGVQDMVEARTVLADERWALVRACLIMGYWLTHPPDRQPKQQNRYRDRAVHGQFQAKAVAYALMAMEEAGAHVP